MLFIDWIGTFIEGNQQLNRAIHNAASDLTAIEKSRGTPPGKIVISLERKVKELTVLSEISQVIRSTLNCHEVFSDILGIFHSHLGMNRGTITLLDPITGELEIKAAHGMTEEEVRRGKYLVGEGITGKVAETGEPAVVPQIGKEPLFLNRTRSRDPVKKSDISFICVSIKMGSLIYGTLLRSP